MKIICRPTQYVIGYSHIYTAQQSPTIIKPAFDVSRVSAFVTSYILRLAISLPIPLV